MPSEAQIAELVSLLDETREQLAYYKELGATGAEKFVAPASVVEDQPAQFAHPVAVDGIRPHVSASSPTSDSLFGDLSAPPVRIPKSTESFEEIWADVGNCTRCPLHQGRTNIVHTDGNRKARLMFVGEAPGADEDAQARPFVGRAGPLLTEIIEAIGLKREEV